ncbi:MAG TPA: hypothetical protein VNJ51_14305 [Candidatus Dormibacteraeota bacterium]|nr:hypothetical protein [Candidatus Dormibacteraeota bacterium]
MSKIFLRYAREDDIPRLITGGVVPTGGESTAWQRRLTLSLAEQRSGRRLVLVAEDRAGLVAMVQLVFKFPPGYHDPEAANGHDIAMIETLRTARRAPAAVSTELLQQAQLLARKKAVTTLTFCLSLDDAKGITMAKQWGFKEFRIMPEADRMLAFFRKDV